jgi:Tol biopolymer transport system component
MDIDRKPKQLTDDSYYKCDPSWSPDGTKIAYSSDKAGTEDIYVLDVASGTEQRVTSLPGAEVSSAWSRDGTRIAFQDQNGSTFTVELATGTVRRVIGPLFAPGKPTWSADGNTIAVGALKAYTRRYREGTSQILTVDVPTGALTYYEPAPFKSLSTRGEDGPVYSPDGTATVFVMEGALWTRPVDAHGHPTGVATQITNEASAAPTWSGDSQRILYVSNGHLRPTSVGSRKRRQDAPSSGPVAFGMASAPTSRQMSTSRSSATGSRASGPTATIPATDKAIRM